MAAFALQFVKGSSTACLIVILLATGCGRSTSSHQYESIEGRVVEVAAATGEITVKGEPRSRREREAEIECVVTRDSELYINDRAAAIGEVRVGDLITIIGYRERATQQERLVVSTASIRRSQPPPPVPGFLREALGPGSRPSSTDGVKPIDSGG